MQQNSPSRTNINNRSVSNGVKKLSAFLLLFIASPFLTFAQGSPSSIQEFGAALVVFLNKVFIPFLFSLALLIFIYNVIRYFIINTDNDQERKKAKRYALYSISAFVLMVSVWGIVNLFVGGIGFDRSDPVCPDIIPDGLCKAWGSAGEGVSYYYFNTVDWGNDPYGEFGGTGSTYVPPGYTNDTIGEFDSPEYCYNSFGDQYLCGDDPGDNKPIQMCTNAFGDEYICGSSSGDQVSICNGTNGESYVCGTDMLTTRGDYSLIAESAANKLYDKFGMENYLLDNLDVIGEEVMSDYDRIKVAKTYLDARLITSNEYTNVVNAVNTVRTLNNNEPIVDNSVVTDQRDVKKLDTYYTNFLETEAWLETYLGATNETSLIVLRMFDTEEATLQERKEYTDGVINFLESQSVGLSDFVASRANENFMIEEGTWVPSL